MGESLTQRRRVREEGLRIEGRRSSDCKPLSAGKKEVTVPAEEVTANYVPAAAVIRRWRALSGITGCKGCVGGIASQA